MFFYFYEIIVRLRHKFFRRYNIFKFKHHGINFAGSIDVIDGIYLNISKNSVVDIGDKFIFRSGAGINALSRNSKGSICTRNKARIIIGNNVQMSSVILRADNEIRIGNNVKLGADVLLLDTDGHSLDFEKRRKLISDQSDVVSKPIFIGDDVLVGTRCIVTKGVTIGARSIIASGSVVVKDIPSDCVAGGNPCKVIRCIK